MLFDTPELDERERQVLSQVEELKAALRFQLAEPRRWAGSLRRVSLARAIQGSNSIEGYEAGLDDAVDVAAGEEPLEADEETRLALRGYRDAMTYVLQLAEDEDFQYSDQLLKSLHYMMTNYALKNRPGRWRAGSIYVRNDTTGEIVHEGADLDLVPGLMRELAAELNAGTECPDIVRAAMAHLNLVMVHPFRDGNGRMARCLQSLVLARSGTLSPVFMSIEEYLGQNTQAYYDVLGEVGGSSWQPRRDARPWVRFTLTAHLRQARTMLQRVKESERMWAELETLVQGRGLPERSTMALFDAMIGLRVRNATYRSYFEDSPEEITEATASRDLRALVAAGLLEANGEKRGRHYVAKPPLVEIRQRARAARGPKDTADPFAD
ncbi:Fic family protein [Amycolatopsis tolypomycina]|uniref:Fic family protein n=1 Tax=Amycolatopsis tolypomycina TaxID=208445 RepID=A0A1H5D8D3_9PSEU|nr:Fic family protein [Amycolatopsis tolypomycina]SED75121.1 Fic family protein [Amycolatopsis tolypomycina]